MGLAPINKQPWLSARQEILIILNGYRITLINMHRLHIIGLMPFDLVFEKCETVSGSWNKQPFVRSYLSPEGSFEKTVFTKKKSYTRWMTEFKDEKKKTTKNGYTHSRINCCRITIIYHITPNHTKQRNLYFSRNLWNHFPVVLSISRVTAHWKKTKCQSPQNRPHEPSSPCSTTA